MSVGASSIGTTGSDKLTDFGQQLKRLLDPNKDTLLPGYAELIYMDAHTLISSIED